MAVLFYPLYKWILRRMPQRPLLAALLCTLFVIVAFLTPVALAISIMVQAMQNAFEASGANGLREGMGHLVSWAKQPLDTIGPWFGTTGEDLSAQIAARLDGAGAALARQTLAMVRGATGSLIAGVIALLTLFFGLRDGAGFARTVIARSPLGPVRTERILDAVTSTIMASFYGVVAVATTQGTLCAIGAWIANLPSPPLWGLGAGFASVVPLFGATLVWLPAAIFLFVQGSTAMGIFMLFWGAFVISSSDNIVRPLVLRARMPANPLVIFIAILGGLQAFGFVGVFLGPVVLGVTIALLDMLHEEITNANLTT